jgi:hypothetical protein
MSNRFSVLETDMVNVDQLTQVHLVQGSKKIKSVPYITGSKNKMFIVGQHSCKENWTNAQGDPG